MSITSFFLGLLLIAIGVLGLKFNYQITNNFGSFGSLEKFFGGGNQYAVFKLLAILLIFVGFVTMFGLGTHLIQALLSPFKSVFPS